MNVLALGAHPDDLELCCGGTLARLVRQGHSVVMCHATDGAAGGYDDPGRVAAVRSREAQAAALVAGATYRSLGIPDGGVDAADPAQLAALIELIRDSRPRLILTHPSCDYHPDHTNLGTLAVDASLKATIALLDVPGEHTPTIPALYCMEPIGSLGFSPSEFVDVTDTFDTKVEMLSAHESQIAYLREHYDVDLLEQAHVVARFRGIQCGARYAEAFTQLLRWPRVGTERLLP